MATVTHDVGPTLERTARIYDALRGAGESPTPITNSLDEPLGVILRDYISPGNVLGSVAVKRKFDERPYDSSSIDELRNTLPISGSHVLPKRFLDIVDLTVQAATDAQDGSLAVRLNSATIGDEAGYSVLGSGLGLHADFPGSTSYLDTGLPLHGLNVHYTRWGSAAVRLGLVRRLEDDGKVVQIKTAHEYKTLTNEERDKAYEALATPFTEPFELRAGDVFIFQAQQHTEKGLVPVMHEFVTTSDTRRSDSFNPHIGEAEPTQARRQEMAEKFKLTDWGY